MDAHVPTLFRLPVGVFSRRLNFQAAIVKISGEFPHLLQVRTGEKRRRSEEAMNFTFISYWSESHQVALLTCRMDRIVNIPKIMVAGNTLSF